MAVHSKNMRNGGLLVALLAGSIASVAEAQKTFGDRTYEVTIENLTSGQPLSPGLIVTHDRSASLFRVGHPASYGIIKIAEDGDPAPALAAANGAPGIFSVTPINAPIHRRGGPGPSSATFQVEAPAAATSLSIAVMLICTNDGFTGLESVPLPNATATSYGHAWDAGSETNDELSESIVDPCGTIGPVALPADGKNDAPAEDGGRITGHRGIAGGGDLTSAHRWRGPVVKITIRLLN